MTYQSIGMSYLNEDTSLHTAKNYFNLSLSIFKNVNDNLRQAHVHFNLGTIYFKENDLRNSLRKFEESYFLAKDLKDRQLIMKNAEMISAVHEKLSDPKKALFYYKISRQYKDSINISEQATEIAAINNRYNFNKKESEIELLKKNKSIQNAQLATNQEIGRAHV